MARAVLVNGFSLAALTIICLFFRKGEIQGDLADQFLQGLVFSFQSRHLQDGGWSRDSLGDPLVDEPGLKTMLLCYLGDRDAIVPDTLNICSLTSLDTAGCPLGIIFPFCIHYTLED